MGPGVVGGGSDNLEYLEDLDPSQVTVQYASASEVCVTSAPVDSEDATKSSGKRMNNSNNTNTTRKSTNRYRSMYPLLTGSEIRDIRQAIGRTWARWIVLQGSSVAMDAFGLFDLDDEGMIMPMELDIHERPQNKTIAIPTLHNMHRSLDQDGHGGVDLTEFSP